MLICTLSRSFSPWVFHRKTMPSLCPGGKVDTSEGWTKSRRPPEPSPERQCAARAQGLGSECLDSSHQSLSVWPQISGSAKSGEWAGLKKDMRAEHRGSALSTGHISGSMVYTTDREAGASISSLYSLFGLTLMNE